MEGKMASRPYSTATCSPTTSTKYGRAGATLCLVTDLPWQILSLPQPLRVKATVHYTPCGDTVRSSFWSQLANLPIDRRSGSQWLLG